MTKMFDRRQAAAPHTVTDGQTLKQVAETVCNPPITWEELALFNWGTKEPDEVNREIVEVIGCDAGDEANPETVALKPSRGTNDRILLPKILTRARLDVRKTHTITAKRLLPSPAIEILALDKWFIPNHETCDIRYKIEGVKDRADKIDLAIYASKYCSATPAADGDFVKYTYTAAPDVWILNKRLKKNAAQRRTHDTTWDGRSRAASGLLKPRQGKRFVNAANSPYTVLLRYFKSDGDKDARLVLDSFWPQFDASGTPDNASLVVSWEVKGCPRLKHGKLVFWDKDGTEVYHHPLKASDLAPGAKKSYDWSAWAATRIVPTKMPYRVQIQARTDMFDDNGVALTAMHTEVRLFAHHDLRLAPADPVSHPQCLEFGVAGFLPKSERKALTEGTPKWYKQRLAVRGFYPGPVDTDAAAADFTAALKELQRSYPKRGGPPHVRLTPNGTTNDDTKRVLKKLSDDERPMFGDPASRADHTRANAGPHLTDKGDNLIVWVQDRHAYTSGAPATTPAAMKMNDYRGAMGIGDARVTTDAASISRPWIPVEVKLALLGKGDALDLAPASMPAVTDDMRKAIGPIGLAWTFTELAQDLSVIPIGANAAEKQRSRARKYVEKVTEAVAGGATHNGKPCTNCPETHGGQPCGGIRPTALADYYKAPFGYGTTNSLLPWRAAEDAGRSTIRTVVHDDLGQADNKFHDDCQGKSGIYLRPSRIAGDGYRFRAQVSFDDLPAPLKTPPNWAVLKKRYPLLPQAHTAGLRVWRKASLRGYVGWLPAPDPGWQNALDEVATQYRAANVHFVHEGAAAHQEFDGATGPLPNRLILPSDFANLIRPILDVAGNPYQGLTPAYKLGYVWPYLSEAHFGIAARPGGMADFRTWLYGSIELTSWDRYSHQLIHLLIQKIEEKRGRLRGHVIVEFRSSPKVVIYEYKCFICRHTVTEIVNDPNSATADTHEDNTIMVTSRYAGRKCPRRLCPGRYRVSDSSTVPRLPLCAIGRSLGGSWVFPGRADNTWSHEIGHHRHLQHAQASESATRAPGAKDEQHDSAANAHQAGATHPHQRFWDRWCIMSYDDSQSKVFCGKCLLRNRGWAVEQIANPAGTEQD
jgi:hypothetical protein